MSNMPGFHEPKEELLEAVWSLCEEKGHATLPDLTAAMGNKDALATLDEVFAQGLAEIRDDTVVLTAQGEKVARHVVRAHRLAARFLTDLLEIDPGSIETLACRLEHAISPELADSLCTLLGHPPSSPTGKPSPKGSCCGGLKREAAQVVRQLNKLELGGRGRVTFIHPRFAQRLDQLSALGLVPGTDIRLTQRHPSVVVDVGETTLALDEDVARDVFVKPLT